MLCKTGGEKSFGEKHARTESTWEEKMKRMLVMFGTTTFNDRTFARRKTQKNFLWFMCFVRYSGGICVIFTTFYCRRARVRKTKTVLIRWRLKAHGHENKNNNTSRHHHHLALMCLLALWYFHVCGRFSLLVLFLAFRRFMITARLFSSVFFVLFCTKIRRRNAFATTLIAIHDRQRGSPCWLSNFGLLIKFSTFISLSFLWACKFSVITGSLFMDWFLKISSKIYLFSLSK